jgi:threonine synthase
MSGLAGEGRFQAGETVKKAMDEILWAGFATDGEGSEMIRKIYGAHRYVMDPHTAVGMAVYEQYRDQTGDETPALIDATASPYKFSGSVLAALGRPVAADEFETLKRLSDYTGEPAHPALLGLKERPRLHRRLCRQNEMGSVVLSIVGLGSGTD